MRLDLPESVCDAHVHVGTFPRLRVNFRLEDLTKIMNKYKIASILLFSSYHNSEQLTKQIINASKKDERIHVLLRANPKKYLEREYVKSMESLLSNERIVGVKINSSVEKHKLTEPIYSKVLRMINRNSGVLLLHCGRWVEMSGWSYGIQIAEKYSQIKVILAHMGGTHPDLSLQAIEASRSLNNVYMDTSQTRQINVIKEGLDKLGSTRILFGSDMPWGNYVQNLVGIQQLELNEKVEENVLRRNFNIIVKGNE